MRFKQFIAEEATAYTEINFKKALKKIGLSKYVVSGNNIVISSPSTGRSHRKEILQSLAQILFKDAIFVDDGRSGFLKVKAGTKIVKIFVKPERVALDIILKPQFFSGITDINIPWNDYADKIEESIRLNSKLDEIQKTLLLSIVDYHRNMNSSKYNQFKKLYAQFKDAIPLNTINNDFSEVLGPLAVLNLNLLGKLPSNKIMVFLPHRGNEPLLDYKLIQVGSKPTVYKISAKSGDQTNTLKPGDVLSLIDGEDILRQKYEGTDQYQVIKLLKDGSWKQGPINAVNYLKSKHYEDAKWLTTDEYTEEIRQKSENTLVKISRTSLNFTDMYLDATRAKVFYVKFKMDNEGNIDWKIIKNDVNRPELSKRIEFRSKNYIGRPNGDKLGFQV